MGGVKPRIRLKFQERRMGVFSRKSEGCAARTGRTKRDIQTRCTVFPGVGSGSDR